MIHNYPRRRIPPSQPLLRKIEQIYRLLNIGIDKDINYPLI